MTDKDLTESLELLEFNSRIGAELLNRAFSTSYSSPTPDQIVSVLPSVLKDIAEHRVTYRIRMNNYDCNKIVAFTAWHLKQKDPTFSTAPMFYGHLHFIDESKRGAPTLHEIPSLAEICENLDIFLTKGHKLAPYTFLKGIDLTYLHCAFAAA